MNLLLGLGWISIVIAIGLVALFGYWFIAPYNILEFKEGNGVFVTSQVRGGEYLSMNQSLCKYSDVPAILNRQFVDGIIYQVPTTISNRQVGCSETVEYVYVPKALPPGKFHIITTISFKVNPIRTKVYTVTTGEFEVIK